MLRFLVFGSGSSGNCYLLMTDTDNLIIDAGVGMRNMKKYFTEYGLKFSGLERILVTHDHADHVKNVGRMAADYNLPIYATKEVHDGINRNICVKKKIPAEHVKYIEKEQTIQLGDFSVTPFHVPHDSADNVGYRIEVEGQVFSIITDCGVITERIGEIINQSNYLVLEANHDREMLKNGIYPDFLKERVASNSGHLSNIQCAEALSTYATPELKHVWLCHLSEENNHPELARKTIEMHLASCGIVAGKDFEFDILKRRQPSGVFTLK